MTQAPDLKQALQLVASTERTSPDPEADLARARAGARSRFRRRFRLGLGAAAVMVAAIAVGPVVAGSDDHPTPKASTAVRLVADPLQAPPYTFDLAPVGWSVQAQTPTAVTIVPDDGSASASAADFRGKLVILFDANRPTGRAIQHDGRQFWISGDSGYTIMATRTLGGEPVGVVRIQYPNGTGWDQDSMLAFLGSVHVGDSAQPGKG